MPLLKRPAAAPVDKRTSARKCQATPPVKKRPSANAALASVPLPPASTDSQSIAQPDWLDKPDESLQNEVFLVTASKLLHGDDADADPPLKDPSGISKHEFRAALQDSMQNPIYDQARGGRPPSRAPELDVYLGVKEPHTDPEHEHHHVALKFYKQKHRFMPFKLAMRRRHGIATHWSTSHTQLWSAVRYLHIPTNRKRRVDRKPEVWTRDGRTLNLYEMSQQPFQASAWKADRERRASEPLHEKTGKNTERFTKLDFNALILAERLLTPSAVIEHVMEKGSLVMQLKGFTCHAALGH